MDEKTTTAQRNYEYLDHTADIQIHSWGKTIVEAFENAAIALIGYMCEIDKVEIDPNLKPYEFEVSNADDMESLLYQFLEEFLFIFTTELLVFKEVKIIEFDRQQWRIKARCRGEKYQKSKHGEGTEVKAITYSNMQIYEAENKAEIYVIVDI